MFFAKSNIGTIIHSDELKRVLKFNKFVRLTAADVDDVLTAEPPRKIRCKLIHIRLMDNIVRDRL